MLFQLQAFCRCRGTGLFHSIMVLKGLQQLAKGLLPLNPVLLFNLVYITCVLIKIDPLLSISFSGAHNLKLIYSCLK